MGNIPGEYQKEIVNVNEEKSHLHHFHAASRSVEQTENVNENEKKFQLHHLNSASHYVSLMRHFHSASRSVNLILPYLLSPHRIIQSFLLNQIVVFS